MLELPIISTLKDSQRVLIAGAGGGFDLFGALPLVFALRAQGKEVHLASLTFSYMGGSDARPERGGLYEVNAQTEGNEGYFPERDYCRWAAQRLGELKERVFCIERLGLTQLRVAYQELQARLNVDTLILIDGGTDSLMRGDEAGLGTPAEDVLSLAATRALPIERKLLICIGFGVDSYHGICHAQFLEGVAELAKKDAYLGAWSLLPSMPEVAQYMEAITYLQGCCPGRESIVSASICSALEGEYGDQHRLDRTRGSVLWINPLMALYWCFKLDAVTDRVLYLDWLEGTSTLAEVWMRIEAYRSQIKPRPYEPIPV